MQCFICGLSAVKRHNRANMCEKHHRFLQMQKTAKADGKVVPSIFELESLVPNGMLCQDCGVEMHWIDDKNRCSGAVLQHYRDETLGIVCHSCNVKHGFMPGDMYRDVSDNHKLCTSCRVIKPISSFGIRKDSKKIYPLSKCKVCMKLSYQAWRQNNPEKYKALNKKHNDKRKEKSNGVAI
jgi:hypothetical protein